MLIECKGGFPRFYVNIDKKDHKSELGFSNTNIKSISELMKQKKNKIIGINSVKNQINIVGGGNKEETGKCSDEINGIPISVIVG